MDYFPLEGFNHVTNIGVLIYDLLCEVVAEGVQSFGSTLCTQTICYIFHFIIAAREINDLIQVYLDTGAKISS